MLLSGLLGTVRTTQSRPSRSYELLLPVNLLLPNATIFGRRVKREVQEAVVGGVAEGEVEERGEVEEDLMIAMMTLSLHPTCLDPLVQHRSLISLTLK